MGADESRLGDVKHADEPFRWPWEQTAHSKDCETSSSVADGSLQIDAPDSSLTEHDGVASTADASFETDTDTDEEDPEDIVSAPIKLLITAPDGEEREYHGEGSDAEHTEIPLAAQTLHKCMKRDVSNVDLMSLDDNHDFPEWLQRSEAIWASDIRDFPAGTPLLNGGVIPEEHQEVYDFQHAGYRCQLSRNAFLAWQGSVTIPENHPLYNVRISVVHSCGLKVHGGITTVGTGIIGFDCHHGLTDIAPYEGYATNRMKELRKLVGKLADSCDPDKPKPHEEPSSSSDAAHEESLDGRNVSSTLLPPRFLKPTVPCFGGKRTYKNYHFARRELCSLAEQLARLWPPVDGNPQDDAFI